MTTDIQPQIRLLFSGGDRIGPGKIDLLEAIERSGSIAAGGRALKMSYRRAWLLTDALNQMFDQPVVIAATGGARGGGAEVTELGRTLIAVYRRIEGSMQSAVEKEFAPLKRHLSKTGSP